MPLNVITANRGKDYSIFEKLNPFVEKLVGAYKQSQMKKWDAEWQLEGMNILEKAGNQGTAKNLISNENPPKDYMDIEGATNWAKEIVGNMSMVQQKEVVTGGLTPTATPEKMGLSMEKETVTERIDGQEPELIPDKMEWNEAFKMISELDTGKPDWSSLTAMFKQRIESGKAMGSAASSFLNMIMGKQPTDQRAELGRNIDMTDKYMSAFHPEEEKTFDDKAFLGANPNMELKSVSSTGHRSYGLRAEEKPTFDFETFLKENSDWEIKSVSGTGNISMGRKDTTKKWEFDTWEEAKGWAKAHEQEGYEWKIETQSEGFNVTAMKKTTTPEGGTKKIIPTYGVIQTISKDLLDPSKEYDTTMARADVKYDFSDPSINLPTKADQAQRAYSLFEQIIYDEDNKFVDEKGMVKNPEGYSDYYKDYEKFAETYYNETGQVLPKGYLSLEEAGKYTSLTWGTGEKGGYKPVKNTENIPWNWQGNQDKTQEIYNRMKQEGLTIKDMNLEALSKDGVDINKLLQMFK